MNDPEFREMLNKAIFIVAVVLVFTIPVYFIFKNKIMVQESTTLKEIRNNKTIMLYITENNCKQCKILKKELDKTDIEYEEINKDKEKNYNRILSQLGLKSSTITVPSLIYVEEGKVISFVVDIDSKEKIKEYINNYK
jgi:glutaredoxin